MRAECGALKLRAQAIISGHACQSVCSDRISSTAERQRRSGQYFEGTRGPRSVRQLGVSCDQDGVNVFSERDVCRVVGGQVLTQPPAAIQQHAMLDPADRHLFEVSDGLLGSSGGEVPSIGQSPPCRQDFEIDQMRCNQLFAA